MTAMGIPANAKQLAVLVQEGEGQALEFKRSTGELKEDMQTLRDIAQAADRFEPPAHVSIHGIKIKAGREVVLAAVEGGVDMRPFTYEGRPYERVGSTTRRMPQARYERLLVERGHAKRRWENEPAEGVELRDIDRDELFRIVENAKSAGRLIGPVGTRVADVLDRLKLRREGRILQAAVVLFGKEFLPDYPQCELRMARFRGADKTEFLDQRHIRGPAFTLLEEAQLFCQRHFPLPGKIVPGKLQRVDTPLVPPDAMREILVNALIHRDYSIAGGAISLAIFDDRVEVWSAGTFPTGITPEKLSKSHQSVQRNPIVADIFYKSGLIEKWGRGTNRVIEMCLEAGIAPPKFEEITGAAVVTFKVNVRGPQQVADHVVWRLGTDAVPSLSQVGTKSGPSRDQVKILRLCRQERTVVELMNASGRRNRTKFRDGFIKPLLEEGLLVLTIPDKPRSRMQRYRTTEAGLAALSDPARKS